MVEIEYESHAQQRAMDRFGIYLSIQDLERLGERIYNGDAEYIGRGRRGMSIWCIEFQGQKLYPLMDFEDKFILTFLTKPMAYRTSDKQRKLAKRAH